MELSKGKTFEKAPGGLYFGTIIDVVDMPNVQTQFGPKNKVRILWLLNNTNGTPAMGAAVDATGQPKVPEQLTVAFIKNASLHEKSELFKMVTMILNAAPPVMNSTEQLAQLLIGRSNQLFLTQTPDTKKQGEFFTNVSGVSPLGAGQVAPAIPTGYVRAKDKPAKTYGQSGQQQFVAQTAQPAGTTAGAPVTNTAPTVNLNSF